MTRREWKWTHAARFHAGDLVAALDHNYGGKQIATIRLMSDPYEEYVADADESEYEAEGLAWMQERGLMVPTIPSGGKMFGPVTPWQFWKLWQSANPLVWVVRFELVKS